MAFPHWCANMWELSENNWCVTNIWLLLDHTKTPLRHSVNQDMIFILRRAPLQKKKELKYVYFFCLFLIRLEQLLLLSVQFFPCDLLNACYTKPYAQNKQSFVEVLGKEAVERAHTHTWAHSNKTAVCRRRCFSSCISGVCVICHTGCAVTVKRCR